MIDRDLLTYDNKSWSLKLRINTDIRRYNRIKSLDTPQERDKLIRVYHGLIHKVAEGFNIDTEYSVKEAFRAYNVIASTIPNCIFDYEYYENS